MWDPMGYQTAEHERGEFARQMQAERVYVTCADTAKLVRVALRDAFPGVKFYVRSETYANGASIHVRYVDGPLQGDVEKVTNRFVGSDFDGMIDLKTYRSTVEIGDDGKVRQIHYGADHIFVRREYTAGHLLPLIEKAQATLDKFHAQGFTDREAVWQAAIDLGLGGSYAAHAHGLDCLVRYMAQETVGERHKAKVETADIWRLTR